MAIDINKEFDNYYDSLSIKYKDILLDTFAEYLVDVITGEAEITEEFYNTVKEYIDNYENSKG
jgi:hypothetical protein